MATKTIPASAGQYDTFKRNIKDLSDDRALALQLAEDAGKASGIERMVLLECAVTLWVAGFKRGGVQ